MKKVAISQSNYIPWKGFFDMINSVDEFVIYDDMQFTKRDWRNRNQIKTANGLLWLTIPVKVRGKFHQKIYETEIESSDWAEKHWKTIQMAYSKAPFFRSQSAKFEALYESASKMPLLSDVNELFLKEICKILEINTPFLHSRDLVLHEEKTQRLVNICQDLKATAYVSGPAAKDYIDSDQFSRAGVQLKWMNYQNYQTYPQLHGDFAHGVSVLDLIFNVGPDFKQYMKSFSGEPMYE